MSVSTKQGYSWPDPTPFRPFSKAAPNMSRPPFMVNCFPLWAKDLRLLVRGMTACLSSGRSTVCLTGFQKPYSSHSVSGRACRF